MTEEQIQYLQIDRIEFRPQVREQFDEESLLGLARSIQEAGRILQPVRVRRVDGVYVALDGERRIRAAKSLGHSMVPAIIEDKDLCPAEVLHRQLILDCQKAQLTAVERARAIKTLMTESRWSASQVAQRVGISPSMVTKLLAVLELPDDAQEQVASGAIGMSTAYAITRTENAETKAILLREAGNGRVTRSRAIEQSRPRKSRRRVAARRRQRESVVLPIADGCSMALVGSDHLTVAALGEWLAEFLERLRVIEPQDTLWADAAKQFLTRTG